MDVRTVTARWINGDGSPIPFAVTTFEIDPSTYGVDELVSGKTTITNIADAAGIMGQPLIVNEQGLEPSRWVVTWPSGRQDAFVLSPGDTPISLRELLGMQLPGWTPPSDATAIDIAISGVYDALANTNNETLGDAMVGTFYPPELGMPRTVHDKLADAVSIFDVIPQSLHDDIWAGTSTWDSADTWNALFVWAKEQNRPIKAEGGTFFITKPVVVLYHCDLLAATFMVDNSNLVGIYVGDTGIQNPRRMHCLLPRVYCRGYVPPSVPGTAWGTGTGIVIRNLDSSHIVSRHVRGWYNGVQLIAEDGFQTVYNRVEVFQNEDCKRAWVFSPLGNNNASDGYVNENAIYGGRTSLSTAEGVRQPGTRSVLFEGGFHPVNNNRFHYTSFEGTPEFKLEAIGAHNNLFNWCRWESPVATNVWVKFTSYAGPPVVDSGANVIWYGHYSDHIQVVDDTAQQNNHVYTENQMIINGRSNNGVIRGSNTAGSTAPIFAAVVSKHLADIDTDPNITWYASEDDMVVKGQNDPLGTYRAHFVSATGMLEMAPADNNPRMQLTLDRLRIAASAGASVIVNNRSGDDLPVNQVMDSAADVTVVTPDRAAVSQGTNYTKYRRPRIAGVGDLGPRVQVDHYNGRHVYGDGQGEMFLITMITSAGAAASAGVFVVGWPTLATPTAALPWNISTTALATALAPLYGSGNVLSVTGTPGVQYVIRVGNARINERIPPPAVDGSGLTPANAVQATLGDPYLERFIANVLLIADGYRLNPTLSLNPAVAGNRGVVRYLEGASGVADRMLMQRKNTSDQYGWVSMLGDSLIAVSNFASSGNPIDTFTVGTADTVVFTTTIPGGTLGTTNKIRIALIGKLLNNSGGNVTFNIRMRYGGIVVANITTAAIPTNSADRPVDFEATLSGRHSASFQVAKSQLATGNGSGSAGVQIAVSSIYTAVHMTNALNANSNLDQTLNISLSMTPAGASAGLVVFTVSTVHIEAIH